MAETPSSTTVSTRLQRIAARLWNARTGQELVTFKGHSGWVLSAVFSPDGKRVLTASWDNTARLWEAQTGHELLSLKDPGFEAGPSRAPTASFSPDGKRILAAFGTVAFIRPITPDAFLKEACDLLRYQPALPPREEYDEAQKDCARFSGEAR